MGVNARERLRQLSIVFAVELRMKIVIELYMREMSARQFFEEFGGGSPSRVNQNFTRLAKESWLRHIRSEGPGGTRHGGVEHFYRATELPFIDSESWALVPFSVRAISTWNFLKQVMPRLRGDLEAATRDATYSRELSCTTFLLDEEGWHRAAAAVSGQFARLFEEQEDARRRALHSGEELIRADVFLIAFESLGSAAQSTMVDQLVECQREPLAPFPQRLAPILQDDVRLEIVSESNKREISVTQFHREVGGASKPAVGRRFKGLEGGGWLGKGRTVSGGLRRAGVEQFFRATKPAIRGYDFSADPLGRLAGTEAWRAFESLSELAREALIAGTFDTRTDRCLSWSLIRLDRQGLESVVASIESLPRLISEEQERARMRMAKSGEKPIPLTVGLAAFEAPKELVKAP
jgi:DNA-binding transcriptional ArsR family regulator